MQPTVEQALPLAPVNVDWSKLSLDRAMPLLDSLHEFKREQFTKVSAATAKLRELEQELHTLFEQRRAELEQQLATALTLGEQLRDKALGDASQQPDTLDARTEQLKRELTALTALQQDSVLARYVKRVAEAIPEQDRWEEERACWMAGQ